MNFFNRYSGHYKDLVNLGVPIVIGQIGIIIVGLADNIMVGKFDTLHLAAASFVNSAFNIPILFGLGFSYGLTPLVGQLFGKQERFQIGKLLRNSLLANLCMAILLSLVMGFVWLNLDRMGQPAELLPVIRPYFLLQLVSLVFVMLFNSFKQFADGISDTRTPMFIMIAGNVLNIIGNYVLIYGELGLPALGIVGAGISTLASRIFMLAAFAVLFYRNIHYRKYLVGYKRSRFNGKDILLLNRMGWMTGLQLGVETALFSITGILIGWLGSVELAAHQITVSVSTIGFMVYYGLAAALSVRVSNYYGKGEMEKIRDTTHAGFHLILAAVFAASCIFFFTKDFIGYTFTDSEDVCRTVASLMGILVLYQFGDGLQITYSNALRGLGDVEAMALISFIGYFVLALPVSYIFGFVLGGGIEGIWISYPVGLSLTGIMMSWRFYNRLHQKPGRNGN